MFTNHQVWKAYQKYISLHERYTSEKPQGENKEFLAQQVEHGFTKYVFHGTDGLTSFINYLNTHKDVL